MPKNNALRKVAIVQLKRNILLVPYFMMFSL
jgi:hypothetical protein